jgi:23S rRNA-/tRNA-specific pseudouridylate synthase
MPAPYLDEEPAKPEVAPAPLPTAVQNVIVTPDENGMRVDRFLEAHFPGLSFSHIQRIVRKGELRVNGKRADSKDRLEEGQTVRIPPLKLDAPKVVGELSEAANKTLQALKEMTIYEDADVMVLNKPAGLAVQGGSGMTRHVDMMLEVMRDAKGQKPRLVHRLDRETSGCLLIAKTRFAATKLTGAFRERSARKIYWALVAGVPKPKQGRISTYLAKEENEEDTIMRVAKHGDEGASHAVTYYAVVETSAQKLAYGAYRPRHRRRPEIFQHRELAVAGRHSEAFASAGAPHCDPASAWRRDRRDGAAAAAYAAIVELARSRTRPVRSDRERTGRVGRCRAPTTSRARRRQPPTCPISTPRFARVCMICLCGAAISGASSPIHCLRAFSIACSIPRASRLRWA